MTTTTSRPARRNRSRAREASQLGWRQYLRALGPGLVTGASDDDPSGIATYAQAGAKFGFGLLWSALLTFPLMAAVQEMCDRTALATGKGLGELALKRFDRRWRRVLVVLIGALMLANVLNIAADLVAVGSGMNLLHAGPTVLWALIAGVAVSVLVMTGSFETIGRVFKVLCLALLSYFAVLVMSHPSWGSIATHTLAPHIQFSSAYLALIVAVLGTTISPYLFFWQSAHRMEDLRDEKAGGGRARPLKDRGGVEAKKKQRTSRLDVFTGMAFSNLVMFAIIVAAATTLGHQGHHDVTSAAQAAQALKPAAGKWAQELFALGFIGSGMLAVPVLAGSGAVGMAGLLGKTWGFSKSPRQAPVFYGLVALGTLGGTLLSLLHADPIRLLVLVAVINGVAAAPFLVVIMRIANDTRIMGRRRNGRLSNWLGWITVALMAAAAASLLVTGGGG